MEKKGMIIRFRPHFFYTYQNVRGMATDSTSITLLMTSRQFQILPLVYHLTNESRRDATNHIKMPCLFFIRLLILWSKRNYYVRIPQKY